MVTANIEKCQESQLELATDLEKSFNTGVTRLDILDALASTGLMLVPDVSMYASKAYIEALSL